jgi:hypothetical protein
MSGCFFFILSLYILQMFECLECGKKLACCQTSSAPWQQSSRDRWPIKEKHLWGFLRDLLQPVMRLTKLVVDDMKALSWDILVGDRMGIVSDDLWSSYCKIEEGIFSDRCSRTIICRLSLLVISCLSPQIARRIGKLVCINAELI